MATMNDPTDTNGRLIAAGKVNGTSVYDPAGEKLGSIFHDVMLDKASGKADYAIMSFGGFLGMGSSYHPLPWSELTYDEGLGGYVVGIDRSVLEGASRIRHRRRVCLGRSELRSPDRRRLR